ncbi:MAG: alpha/beta hydrolase [Pseudobacteriovorax sp.]|nr:alpha/beta hydrolase [Pseudobacteriovorax sp.]
MLAFRMLLVIMILLNLSCSKETTVSDLSDRYPEEFKQQVQLSHGQTHYEWLGDGSNGETVVLIHGVSGPMKSWDATTSRLRKHGFRVLRYDLYGRGYSDRIDSQYDLNLYISQLNELVRHLQISRFHLVGSSMGAIVASHYAQTYPKEVASIALIGPAGFPIEVPFLAKFRDIPVIGDLVFSLFGRAIIYRQNVKYFLDPEPFAAFLQFFSDQLKVKGTDPAMLRTMRSVPVQNYESGYKALNALGIPTLVIWGREDQTFPYSFYTKIKSQITHAKMVTVDDAAHLPHLEKPEETNRALIEFVQSF